MTTYTLSECGEDLAVTFDGVPTFTLTPAVSLDGVAVSLTAPLVTGNTLLFQLPRAATTALITTVTGWAASPSGPTTGGTFTATRASLLQPIGPRNMAVGWNAPPADFASPVPLTSNRFALGGWQAWGTGSTFTTDADGNLLTLSGTVISQVAGANLNNGSSKPGYPLPSGNWRLTGEWTTCQVDMLDLNQLATTEAFPPTVNGNRHAQLFAAKGPTTAYDYTYWVRVQQPSGPCDLRNVFVYDPVETGGGVISSSLKRQMGTPAVARTMDACRVNNSNLTAYSQWPTATSVFAGGATSVVVNLTAIGPYSDPQGWFGNTRCKIQLACSAPHNLIKGQVVRLAGTQLTGLKFADGNTYSLDGNLTLVYTIDDLTLGAIAGAPAQLSSINPLTTATATMTIVLPAPVSLLGSLSAETNADLWVNIPHLLPPVEQAKLLGAYVAVLPKGRKLYLARSNETWNLTVANMQAFYDQGEAALLGVSTGTYHAIQSAALFSLARTIFAGVGRSADLVCVIEGFWASVQRTTDIATWFATNKQDFDLFPIAPYIDSGPVAPAWFATATIDHAFDALELWLEGQPNYTQAMANHQAVLTAKGVSAKVGFYEGSLEQGIASGPNYAAMSRAMPYHPRAANVIDRWLDMQAKGGAAVGCWYSAAVPYGTDTQNQVSLCYGAYAGPTMVNGDGTGASGNNNLVNTGLDQMDSVVGNTLAKWMTGSVITPASPTPTPTPVPVPTPVTPIPTPVPTPVPVPTPTSIPTPVVPTPTPVTPTPTPVPVTTFIPGTDASIAWQALHDEATGPTTIVIPKGDYLWSTVNWWKNYITTRGAGNYETSLNTQVPVPGFLIGHQPVATDGVSVTTANRPSSVGVLDGSVTSSGFNTLGRQYLMPVCSQFTYGLPKAGGGWGYNGDLPLTYRFAWEFNSPPTVSMPLFGTGDFASSRPHPANVFWDSNHPNSVGFEFLTSADADGVNRVCYFPGVLPTGLNRGEITISASGVTGWVNGTTITAPEWDVPVQANLDGLGLLPQFFDAPFLVGQTGLSPGTSPAGAASDITVHGLSVSADAGGDPGTDQLRYFNPASIAFIDFRVAPVSPSSRFMTTYEGYGSVQGRMLIMDGRADLQVSTTGATLSDLTVVNAGPALLYHRVQKLTVRNVRGIGGRQGRASTRFVTSYPVNFYDCEWSGSDSAVSDFAATGTEDNAIVASSGNAIIRATEADIEWRGKTLCSPIGQGLRYCVVNFRGDDGCVTRFAYIEVDDETGGAFSGGQIYAENGGRYPARLQIDGGAFAPITGPTMVMRRAGRRGRGRVQLASAPATGLPVITLVGFSVPGIGMARCTADAILVNGTNVPTIKLVGPAGQWVVNSTF